MISFEKMVYSFQLVRWNLDFSVTKLERKRKLVLEIGFKKSKETLNYSGYKSPTYSFMISKCYIYK